VQEENEKMAEIRILKSIVNDYFALQKNNDVPFYFNKEDLNGILQKLNNLKEEISTNHREIKVYCFACDTVLEILDSNICYCIKCDKFYSEEEIRNNCGI